ncbi:MAG: sugar isomerase domain-containing protein [Bdellovibrionales bacterium]|nr:sugar isomerase domain-containing protein [Bdellovibrionales bacterium]
MSKVTVRSYAEVAIPHLGRILDANEETMKRLQKRLVADVIAGKSLLVFGSGHSGIFPMEVYHRAGGASFIVPIFADYLLPTAGPSVVRVLERTPGVAQAILRRSEPKAGEMIWISSQSGINGAVVDLALSAKEMGLFVVAFTSRAHSSAVQSRHPSGKRLFEVADEVMDLGGQVGDACVEIAPTVSAGPLSTLGSVFLGHSLLVSTLSELEAKGHRVTYTSVNTPEGEKRNKAIEDQAQKRDPLLR